jgi:molybdopterin-guanine dinucleotide biosynthesis protein B
MTAPATKPPVIGIAGWKNSGKTTLTVRLVEELTRRGYRIATIKHAHHAFEIDDGATDSARHRRAGAHQVAIVSGKRWAIVRELDSDPEPALETILARLDPSDLVIVEGYKRAPIAKIEVRRTAAARHETLSDNDPSVRAIVTDHPVARTHLPVFDLDDVKAIADFIITETGLPTRIAAMDNPE